MHGRPRQRAGEHVLPDKKELAHAAELRKLVPVVLQNNRTCCYSNEALVQNARLLELNPEFYTAWNYRKRAVRHLLELEPEEEARKIIAQTELDLVVRALKVNHKSYGAWYHRKWVIRLGFSSLDAEFMLLQKLLKLDARNFHGWNYRRFVASMKGVTPAAELLFTTEKINENFSNYSAWHNRSALLSEISRIESKEIGSVQERLEEEYELVRNSFYTDPDDQSGWFYYAWLLGQTVPPVCTQLNGIWPPAGSQICVDSKRICRLPFVGSVQRLESLPLVLSFSNPVTGVNNQSVSVTMNAEGPSQLDWRPIMASHKYSLRWTTDFMGHLLARDGNFTVDILVGAAEGITSQDAQALDSSWLSNFHVHSGLDISVGESDLRKHVDVKGQDKALTEVWQVEVLEREIEMCRELLELESDSKWTRLTLARLLLAHATYGTRCCESHIKEARLHFEELASLDPTHSEYYQHQQSFLSLKELVADSNILKGNYEEHGMLQLKSLSLSAIGYTQSFLWVQRLDLSNNFLRSTHGLEALQVLEYLDISHNQIVSLTALAPLRELPLLTDVDVSFNDIGVHTVDTCRVLFPSQLTTGSQVIPHHILCQPGSPKSLVKCGKYWEIEAIFQHVRWRNLNLVGNPVTQDAEFIATLKEAMDGSCIQAHG